MKKSFILLMFACILITSNCVYAKGHHKPHPMRGNHANIHIHNHQPPPPRHYRPTHRPLHYSWWSNPHCNHFLPFWCGCNGGRFSLNISI